MPPHSIWWAWFCFPTFLLPFVPKAQNDQVAAGLGTDSFQYFRGIDHRAKLPVEITKSRRMYYLRGTQGTVQGGAGKARSRIGNHEGAKTQVACHSNSG